MIDTMIGHTINNYILERKIGEGGMGDVYFARHGLIDRVVAIKVLHKTLFTHTNIRNRFKNEANALIKLGHPNIVKIYDYVEQGDIACLIMEYIEGFTLDDYITKVTGPLPAPKATHIICSVLDAVQYAHDKNIFHRDIKPANIMVSKDGKTVKIMDFGIAKFADASNLKTTHANAQLGTPFYMSPEQVKGLPYTALSDIYSLGVTFFEMVTGKCPYQEITNLFELQSKIVNETLPPTGKYYPDVTLKIQEVINIATSKIPEQRFKSCHDFMSYLLGNEQPNPIISQNQPLRQKTVLQQSNPGVLSPEQTESQPFFEEKKKSNSWVYLLVLLAILVFGVFTYLYLKQPNANLPQPKVIVSPFAPVSIKKVTVPDTVVKPNNKASEPSVARIKAPETKIDTQSVAVPVKSKLHKKKNPFLARNAKPGPKPQLFQNVKNDLLNYLAGRKSFGGIEYNGISDITIESVSDMGTDESGTKAYDVALTLNGEDLNCQVLYVLNASKPQIKALK